MWPDLTSVAENSAFLNLSERPNSAFLTQLYARAEIRVCAK
jgi:hypothetical protein